MVKNKALPDSARPCKHPRLVIHFLSLCLSLSLSLEDLALSRRVSRAFSLSLFLSLSLSLSPTPFILRVPPGSCRGWTPATHQWNCFKNEMLKKWDVLQHFCTLHDEIILKMINSCSFVFISSFTHLLVPLMWQALILELSWQNRQNLHLMEFSF